MMLYCSQANFLVVFLLVESFLRDFTEAVDTGNHEFLILVLALFLNHLDLEADQYALNFTFI